MTPEQIARVAYRAGFRGDALDIAVAVAMAESSGNPKAIGDVGIQTGTWGPSVGLWQIRSLNAERGRGTVRDELANDNPLHNARAAYSVSSKGTSFQPWTMYTNGGYRQHLARAKRATAAVERDARDGSLRGSRTMGGGSLGGPGGSDGKAKSKAKGTGKPAARRGSGGPSRSGRITISIPELTRLASTLGGLRSAVTSSRGRLIGVAAQLEQLQGGVEDPAPIRRILATLDELTGERPMGTITMPRVGRQLATDIEIVTRCRDLARRADDGSLGTMPAARVAHVLRDAKQRGASASVLAVLEAALLGRLAAKPASRASVGRPGSNRPRRPRHARPDGGGGNAGMTSRERKVSRLVMMAKSQVGTRASGSNNGAWGGTFVTWCFVKAGLRLPDLHKGDPGRTGFALVADGARALNEKGQLHRRPREGDIAFFSDADGRTGIVTSVSADGTTYRTVEGDAGPALDRVVERSHILGQRPVHGFGRPI